MIFIYKCEPHPYNLGQCRPSAQHPTSTSLESHEVSATSLVCLFCDYLTIMQCKSIERRESGKSCFLKATHPFCHPDSNLNTVNISIPLLPHLPRRPTNLVNPPRATTNGSLALLDPIFVSATPPPLHRS